jgi:hypothetical protein
VSRTRARTPQENAPADGGRLIGLHDEAAVWRLATGVLGQTALLTALLLFFGWARTQATFAYFGVDLALLDFSTTDYVLRSVNSAYHPLLLIGLAFLAGTLAHAQLGGRQVGRWSARTVNRAVSVLGWILVTIGVSALLFTAWSRQLGSWVPDEPGLAFAWLPATLATGFALLISAAPSRSGEALVSSNDRSPYQAFALVALFVMALFWTVSLLAVYDGRARARAIERDPAALAEVALLSAHVLAIQGPDVNSTDLGLPDARYRKSYTGLRLLAHADGKYFLIPLRWRRGRDRVFQVPDDASVRIELIAH